MDFGVVLVYSDFFEGEKCDVLILGWLFKIVFLGGLMGGRLFVLMFKVIDFCFCGLVDMVVLLILVGYV